MATKKTTRTWPQLEAMLEEWKVPYELVEDFDLGQVKQAEYSQVRTVGSRAPRENVEQYALQMQNGAIFPPIVLAANDNSIIDGNTRLSAYHRLNTVAAAVYLVKPADEKMARAIGAALNMMGGQRLTPGELEQAARDYLDAGFTDAEIGRRLGRTAEWARKFRKRSEFDARTNGSEVKVPALVAEKLADIRLDAPFQKVLDATREGIKIDRATATKIVEVENNARSEAQALVEVENVIAALKPIQAQGGKARTVKDKPNRELLKAMSLADTLTLLLGKVDVPLVDPAASQHRATLVALRNAVDGLIARLPVNDAA